MYIEKIKKLVCAGCGKIEEKKENDFLLDVIEKNVKEWPLQIENETVNGFFWCNVCR